MTLLVAYEDHYCRELDRALRRVVSRSGRLEVQREFHPVDGVTNFARFVREDWRRFRDQGFPLRGKPKPTVLLCVVDADAVVAQLGVTAKSGSSQDWLAQAEQQVTDILRAETDRPEQVHCALLRWNLESTLIAAHDEPEALNRLAGTQPVRAADLDAFLSKCVPDPRTIADEAFTDSFDDSQRCLRELASSIGWRKLKKG